MRALVYDGPRKVSVKQMPDPKIQAPADVIVRTTTNICGSDLHMYEGRTDLEKGRIIGHENLGEVIECGPAVARLKKGDRVCVPFNIACGYCKNCERGQAPVKAYNRHLCRLIREDKAIPRSSSRTSCHWKMLKPHMHH